MIKAMAFVQIYYSKDYILFIIKRKIKKLMEQDLLGINKQQKSEDILGLDNVQDKISQIKDAIIPASVCKDQSDIQLTFQFTTKGTPASIAKKINGVVQILNNDVINLERLKECFAEGIPDEAAVIRQYCWKLILGYLPPEKAKWKETIEREKNVYDGFVKMFLPEDKFEGYPLLLRKGHPRFTQLQADYILWEQIQKDTSRTHAQFSFFATSSQEIMIPYLTNSRRQKFKLINGQNQLNYKQFLQSKQKQRKTYRYDYMTRILYIYSRLNPRIEYVQGMNEILAPIFYLVNVTKPANKIQESSCFYMFMSAISDIISLHIKDLDKSQNGIYGKLNQVNEMLVVIEPMIWNRLDKLKIDPFYYCFRWVTLLYAQDFDLFDILRIWQSIFSASDRQQFISFFAVAIIMSCKNVILTSQFTVILQHLQNIRQNVNINSVIQIANGLYIQFKDKNFKEHAIKTKKAIQKKEKQRKKSSDQQQSDGQEKAPRKKGNFLNKLNNFVDKYF